MTNNSAVPATLRFMKRWPGYDEEKPYTVDTRVGRWKGNVARTNYKGEGVSNVLIQDLRGQEDQFSFEANGFAVLETHSSLNYEDFYLTDKVDAVYCPEIAACLMQYFDAAAVQIYDVEVRRRHAQFPDIRMVPGMTSQPAQRAHIDGTLPSCIDLLRETESTALEYKRQMFVNVWRPLRGPLHDWPLALCDAQTVSKEDLNSHDHVFTDYSRENVMVHHNTQQKWYYLSGQMPSELLVFRQADSGGKMGVPHCAFDLPEKPSIKQLLRESVEVRAVVLFD